MSTNNRALALLDELGGELDRLQASAAQRCPSDQVRLIDANFARAITSYERLHTQIQYVTQLLERCDERRARERSTNVRRLYPKPRR